MQAYLGIDVGTGSVRAGIFDRDGKRLAHATREIRSWRPAADFVEQSTEDIWQRLCESVRSALEASGLPAEAVRGVGFDATCSLAVADEAGTPVSVSPTGRDEQNVIVWMDHRAREEAAAINAGAHAVLRNVGGRISPEMEIPKILWLKKHLPASYERAGHFWDLPDYLTYRATGSLSRSRCSTVCKMTYQAAPSGAGWDAAFFRSIGLADLAEAEFRRIGREIRPVGGGAGQLTETAATELGLCPGTPVAVSLIDAHAGGVGMLGASLEGFIDPLPPLENRLALIGGTSSCHLALSSQPRFIEGIWGPYFEAMVPGFWLNEGGQSATGALLDHVISNHAAAPDLRESALRDRLTVYEFLNRRLEQLAGGGSIGGMTGQLHLLPDFHGNRSPLADPDSRGMIMGLTLAQDLDALALLYLAAIQGIAYGTRHIIESMRDSGYGIEAVLACGGGIKNPVFVQQHADILGIPLVIPREPEAVLLGSAIAGATAAGTFGSLPEAMAAMSGAGEVIPPDPAERSFHDAKYAVFQELHACQRRCREILSEF